MELLHMYPISQHHYGADSVVYNLQNTIVGFFERLLDAVVILGVSHLMVDLECCTPFLDNLTFGIITIFRLILSLDYIEDYIIQIKICQAFFRNNLSLHTGLVLRLPDILCLLS